MIFGRVALDQARGGILAHNTKTANRVLRKGALLDDAAIALLRQAGVAEVTVARLEPGDVPEGEAASHLSDLLLGPFLRRSADVHGRVNLIATTSGLLRLDVEALHEFNRIDESVTLATLPDRAVVAPGDLVATLKIIPFAVTAATIAAAKDVIAHGALSIAPFRPLHMGLVLTTLPQLKEAALTQTIEATSTRITARGGFLLPPRQTPHEPAPLTEAITALLAADAELILISGASAVTDRQDIAPAAIVAAGGQITHFGMPVDPGNLICFGRIGDRPVIILPGCARSPALNGIDWVLDRIFAGEILGPREIASMGVGGLLKEIESRPDPRAAKNGASVAALVLAAGRSTRMGHNKLLTRLRDGRTMIEHTVDHVLAAAARPVLVVTGHDGAAIRAALAGKPVRFVAAPDYALGLASSLHAGIAALPPESGAALICLGDMPLVEPGVLNQLVAAFAPQEGREIVLPSVNGQRGNPVLWGRRFFDELLALTGDAGARQILHRHMEFVAEVPVQSDTVLRDFDTPEDLKKGYFL
ncbi:molybdopterin-binding/glycosyltransferase family 2 protein [Acidocella sp.]|uniref:molybdopterin-binding/glycosyltransferase family 2 protein n=1 Tax=Acidocella sp. TaxID=50710 RepID=UPI002F3E2786